MKIRKIGTAEEKIELQMTPMIDIVFLLIIFFMVGTQFTEQERQFDVQVPSVSDAPPLTSRPWSMPASCHSAIAWCWASGSFVSWFKPGGAVLCSSPPKTAPTHDAPVGRRLSDDGGALARL